MDRLTRTQKYAELRDKIAQDREESLKTDGLSQYEDKLRKIETVFNNEADTDLNSRVVSKTEEAFTSDIKKAQEESMRSLDDVLNSMMDINFTNEQVYEEAVKEEIKIKPVQPKAEMSVAPKIKIPEPIKTEIPEPVIKNPVNTVVEEPVDIISTMEINANETKELPGVIEPIDMAINNDFLSATLKGVDDYNREKGRTTLDKLPDSIVDEVRHPQPQSEIKPEEEKIEDLDFSNTVTLEIEKVLAEIREQDKAETKDAPAEAAVFNNAELDAAETFNKAEINNETMEHPVLAKVIEEPVVEIKNINETLSNPVVDTNILDDTIPFEAVKQEDDEEYEDEDEAPSKVLNVILGILIFVLVAVLGVIVYYILVARGILG